MSGNPSKYLISWDSPTDSVELILVLQDNSGLVDMKAEWTLLNNPNHRRSHAPCLNGTFSPQRAFRLKEPRCL